MIVADYRSFHALYLFRDGKGLRHYLTQFVPTKLKEPVGQVLSDVNQQLSNYVRGQVTVAIIVAVMFMIFFKIIGLRYAVTLGGYCWYSKSCSLSG